MATTHTFETVTIVVPDGEAIVVHLPGPEAESVDITGHAAALLYFAELAAAVDTGSDEPMSDLGRVSMSEDVEVTIDGREVPPREVIDLLAASIIGAVLHQVAKVDGSA